MPALEVYVFNLLAASVPDLLSTNSEEIPRTAVKKIAKKITLNSVLK